MAMSLATSRAPLAQQVWLGVVPNLTAPKGFTTSADFPELASSGARWKKALSRVRAFKVTQRYVMRGPEAELRRMFAFLRSQNVAIAAVFGMVEAKGCGTGIEGMVFGPNRNLAAAKRFRDLGADVKFIVADEPLTFGHASDKAAACRYSIEQTAASYADNVRQVRTVFPEAEVVDTESITALESAGELDTWLDLLKAELGAAAPSVLHIDLQWRPGWQEQVRPVLATLRKHNVDYGVIFHASARETTNESWVKAVQSYIVEWERAVPDQPKHVVIQSWNPNPTKTLPESDPGTLPYLVNWFCANTKLPQGCR